MIVYIQLRGCCMARVTRVLWCGKMACASIIVSVALFSAAGYAADSDIYCPQKHPTTSSDFVSANTYGPGIIQCLYKDGNKRTFKPNYVPDVKAVGSYWPGYPGHYLCASSTISIKSSDCPFTLSNSDD